MFRIKRVASRGSAVDESARCLLIVFSNLRPILLQGIRDLPKNPVDCFQLIRQQLMHAGPPRIPCNPEQSRAIPSNPLMGCRAFKAFLEDIAIKLGPTTGMEN